MKNVEYNGVEFGAGFAFLIYLKEDWFIYLFISFVVRKEARFSCFNVAALGRPSIRTPRTANRPLLRTSVRAPNQRTIFP